MKLPPHFRDWRITTLLIVVATAPALLMSIALLTTLYLSSGRDIADKVQRSGELLALSLAESSQYGVVSGNIDSLDSTMQRFMDANAGVEAIEILNAHGTLIRSFGSGSARPGFVFERPIMTYVPNIDLFGDSEPHVSLPKGHQVERFRAGRTVGFVRVLMSSTPVLAERRHSLYWSAAIMLLAFCLSAGVGLLLAQSLRGPLADVLKALRKIRQGDYRIAFRHRPRGEIGEVQNAIETMARELSERSAALEHQVAARTQELQRALTRLVETDIERRRLIAHGNDVVEEERRRIAIELHDQFNASLLAVKLRASALFGRRSTTLDNAEIEAIAATIITSAEQLYDDARRMIKRLHPEILDMLGLEGAIREAVRLFNESVADCRLDYAVDASELPPLPQKIAITAYRVVQEGLSNVVKHSHATSAQVRLHWDSASSRIRLTIADNGNGFVQGEKATGFGLLGMRERVESVGGDLHIASAIDVGTVLTVDLRLG
ncbi:sensor histidine kinase [Burkholderia gladioli]|uniref:sensor histidine kinase n=1 Tax=Burkholderia gladioli TaxID=28095 RepID=UPI00163F8980|nr:ATP-binding protein [Burkholderia gladioli]